MPVPVDPFQFAAHVAPRAADMNLRYKRLYDALDVNEVGLDADSFQPQTFEAAHFEQPAWQQLTLGGVSWSPATLDYYRDAAGVVRIRSIPFTTSGTFTVGMTIGTFPAGYRPVSSSAIVLWKFTQTPGAAYVNNDGTMHVLQQSQTQYGSGTWILYGSFRADG